MQKREVGGFSNSGRFKNTCNARFYYCASDDTIYIVATEDIGPDTEIMVYYPQNTFWEQIAKKRKQARAAMTPEQLVAAKADDVIAKGIKKAAMEVKAAVKAAKKSVEEAAAASETQ